MEYKVFHRGKGRKEENCLHISISLLSGKLLITSPGQGIIYTGHFQFYYMFVYIELCMLCVALSLVSEKGSLNI